jgi:flavin reductase (DIM6/NTAB) family NADH-FMN oxidoreductase RutF
MTSQQVDLRAIMRHWASGVTVVTAFHPTDKVAVGMTVSTFNSVSLEPPLVSIFLKKTTLTAEAVVASQAFGVAILDAHQMDLSNRFAGYDPQYTNHETNFDGLQLTYGATGTPLLSGTLGWVECKVWAVYDGSTHHIIIGQVVNTCATEAIESEPLVYYHRGYHRLTPTGE